MYLHYKQSIKVLGIEQKFSQCLVKRHETVFWGYPGGSVVKNLLAVQETVSRSERSRGEGSGNLLQYSCLGNPTDRGAWQSTVHGVTKELAMTQ